MIPLIGPPQIPPEHQALSQGSHYRGVPTTYPLVIVIFRSPHEGRDPVIEGLVRANPGFRVMAASDGRDYFRSSLSSPERTRNTPA